MTEEKQFKQWDKWLGSIYEDVQSLVIGRHVYREVARIIADNPKIQKPSSFYELMGATFLAWSAMAVRRQADVKNIALHRLLREIERRPEVLSRDRFVRTYMDGWKAPYTEAIPDPTPKNLFNGGARLMTRDEVKALANREYDRCVTLHASHIDPSRVRKEIHELRSKTDKVKTFANKRIAHLVDGDTKAPTFPELDECIACLEKLTTRYRMLFRASAPCMLPTWQFDWMAIFNEPWLPRP